MTAQAVAPNVETIPYDLHRLPHLGSSLLQVAWSDRDKEKCNE